MPLIPLFVPTPTTQSVGQASTSTLALPIAVTKRRPAELAATVSTAQPLSRRKATGLGLAW